MTKKEFIWLVIRFLGIFKLVFSLRSILETISTSFLMLNFLLAFDISEKFVFFGLFGAFLESILCILVVLYLLFFGKSIFYIIHRTSSQSLDAPLERQDYPEILVRFIGAWCLWKIICRIFGVVSCALSMLILSHPEWLLLGDDINLETTKDFLTKLQHSAQQTLTWSIPVTILLYAVLAWYFLKHGRFFINLLNRLWLEKNTEDLNQNPVDPVNPV